MGLHLLQPLPSMEGEGITAELALGLLRAGHSLLANSWQLAAEKAVLLIGN